MCGSFLWIFNKIVASLVSGLKNRKEVYCIDQYAKRVRYQSEYPQVHYLLNI